MQSDTQRFLRILEGSQRTLYKAPQHTASKGAWRAFKKWMEKNGYGSEMLERYKTLEQFNKTATEGMRNDIISLWFKWDKEPKQGVLSRLLSL